MFPVTEVRNKLSVILYIPQGLKAARKRLSTVRRPVVAQRNAQTESSFSLILLVIVAVFLCCQLPRLVLNIAEFASLESPADP